MVRGHVVDAETGAPLPSATVQLKVSANNPAENVPDDWIAPPDVHTGADGAFLFRFVPRPTLGITLHLTADGHVEQWKNWSTLRHGITVDLGAVPMPSGTAFRIRVIEAPDRPCSGLRVSANLAANYMAHGSMLVLGTTDAEGIVSHRISKPGRWRYEIASGLAGDTAGEFELPMQAATFTHTVVLRRPPRDLTISGTVSDTSGAPVTGLSVEMALPGGGFWAANTNQRGAFLFGLRAPWEGTQPLRLRLPQDRWDLDLLDSGGEIRWGADEVKMIVRRRRPASITVMVVDAMTSGAIEHFGASCRPDRDNISTQDLRETPAEERPGGIVEFADLAPGSYRISVFPKSPLAEVLERRVELLEGDAKHERVELSLPAELEVEVVDGATQEPLAGVNLSLGRAFPESAADKVGLQTYRFDRRRNGGMSGGTCIVVLDRATSDAEGHATLRAARETHALVVIAESERCIARLLKGVTLELSLTKLRVEVDAAALLRGIVRPMEILQRFGPTEQELARAAEEEKLSWPEPDRFAGDYGHVQVRRPGDDRPAFEADVSADGTFQLASLPAGRYEVWFEVKASNTTEPLGPLDTIDLRAGETRSLELDASAFLPARASGRFFLDGSPWTGKCGFARRTSSGVHLITAKIDAAGTARSPWLLPGSYVPFIEFERDNVTRYVFDTAPFVIGRGDDVATTVNLERRRLAVTLLDGDGNPVADRRVVPEPMDHPELVWAWRNGERTDARGIAWFDPAPPGRLRVRAFAPDQDVYALASEPPSLVLGEVTAVGSSLTVKLPP